MLLEADVKCYYCGHVSGQVVGDGGQPFKAKAFHPTVGVAISLTHSERLRCNRCGGPVFLDEITVVREKRRAIPRNREMPMASAHSS